MQRRRLRARNATRGTILASECRVADSFLSRGLGLIPRSSLRDGEGLLITRTSTITMFFMRFAIDAVFLTKDGHVTRIAPRLRPWSPVAGARGAASVLELPPGTAARTATQVGDDITLEA
ncbi:MAG: DUF192 domain-containing protein [Chloroflexi bacterium]|nr:DUF192 domain-containing protein [Chloroflexota bacterium]